MQTPRGRQSRTLDDERWDDERWDDERCGDERCGDESAHGRRGPVKRPTDALQNAPLRGAQTSITDLRNMARHFIFALNVCLTPSCVDELSSKAN